MICGDRRIGSDPLQKDADFGPADLAQPAPGKSLDDALDMALDLEDRAGAQVWPDVLDKVYSEALRRLL
jgi:hypothetical protein